jgi:NAD-dependent dihydropyrimidine dehydrogenase PreA subunit
MAEDLNQQGLPYPEMIDEERCTTCGICFRMCPDTAIEVNKPDTKKKEESEK